MTIYLDSDFICHLTNDGTMQEVETDAFDGQPKEYIEGYRYVPQGQTWTREDGVQFSGIMIAPAKDYNRIMTDVAISYLDDDEAETVTVLFENWQSGVAYRAEDKEKNIKADRVQYDGLLYRCVQSHTSQADWTPDITPALWVRTSTDPFPEWVQPTGAHDAYNKGDRVSHLGKHWESDIDANVYEPPMYWSEVE